MNTSRQRIQQIMQEVACSTRLMLLEMCCCTPIIQITVLLSEAANMAHCSFLIRRFILAAWAVGAVIVFFQTTQSSTCTLQVSFVDQPLGGKSAHVLLRACSLNEGGLPSSRAVRMLPPSALTFSPAYPNWPPFIAGPCTVRVEELLPLTTPAFSVLVNVWNRERMVRTTLIQLLKLTREAWELVVLVDGATDESLRSVNSVIDTYLLGWQACGVNASNVMANASNVWPSGTRADNVGNIGVACTLDGAPLPRLVRIVVIVVPEASLMETATNNIMMSVAAASDYPAEFVVILQDDQFMTVPGWNSVLAHPLRTFPDVFSVSARCAHGWPELSKLYGAKCLDSAAIHVSLGEGAPTGAWFFFVADSGNRGPLLFRASVARDLGFLDEVHFGGAWTWGGCDHDINVRAFKLRNGSGQSWVSGMFPLPYTEERCCRSPNTPEGTAMGMRVRAWWEARAVSMPPLRAYGASATHDEVRVLPVLPLAD